MRTKLNSLLRAAAAFIFWFILWEIVARVANVSFILPTATETLATFFNLLFTKKFAISVLMSLLRIIAGFLLGTALGVLLAVLTVKVSVARILISPVMTVIKCTPVASFIIVLWFFIGSGSIPVIIGLLMVLPIIWQNTVDGLCSVDKNLVEVAEVFKFSFSKKMRTLVIPSVLKFLIPAIVTSSGLAWKAGIAAEIITYTQNSIGGAIYNAKSYFEGAELFAWTLTVIILSLIIESAVKKVLSKVRLV